MLKTLIKKQLLEINKSFFYDYRRNRPKTKQGIIISILLYGVLLIGVLGGLFSMLAYSMAGSMVAAGFDWLYFLIMDGIAIVLGIFGSVFSEHGDQIYCGYTFSELGKEIVYCLCLIAGICAVFVGQIEGTCERNRHCVHAHFAGYI